MKIGARVRVGNHQLTTNGCTGQVMGSSHDRVSVSMDSDGKVLVYRKDNLALIMPEPSKDKTFYMLWSPDVKTPARVKYSTLEKLRH